MVFISESGFVLVMTIFGSGSCLIPQVTEGQREEHEGVWPMLISCNKIGNIPGLIGIVSNLNGTGWIFVTFQSKSDHF